MLTVTSVTGNVATKLAAGTYVVTATSSDSKTTLTKTITITDSQPAVVAERTADTVDISKAGTAELAAASCFKYTYNGEEVKNINVSAVDITGTYAAGQNVFFKTATVDVPVYGSVTLSVEVNINKTVTVK